jgi:hypothetical protein
MPGTLFGAVDVLRTAAGVAQLQRPDAPARLTWEIIGANGRALPTPLPGLMPAGRGVRQRHRAQVLMVVPG